MQPAPGYNPYAAAWIEGSLPDGRKYYYNAATGVSTWERPAEFVSTPGAALPAPTNITTTVLAAPAPVKPASNADVAASWRELQNQQGRKYYYNTVTKATVWEMPPDYKGKCDSKSLVEYLEKDAQAKPAIVDRAQGEAQFMAMLREKNLGSRLSWEEALREIINHPHYKSIPTLAERKAAFLRYCEARREEEREDRLRRAMNAKEAFRQLLEARIPPSLRWSEVLPLVKDEATFQAINSTRECAEIFDRWQEEALRRWREEERAARKRGMAALRRLLADLRIDPKEATWQLLLPRLQSHPAFQQNEDIQALKAVEILEAWEDHLREMEAKLPNLLKQAELKERRTERRQRQVFKELLDGLVTRGKLHALSTWPEVWTLIKDHPAYHALLLPKHAPAASALDLYLDRLDQLQQAYLIDRGLIEKILGKRENGSPNLLDDDQVRAQLRAHPDYDQIKDKTHISCYLMEREMYSRLIEPSDAVEVRADKLLLRKRVEAFKHLLKHFNTPPITIHSSWAEMRPHLRKQSEFIALPDEQLRREYFEKYLLYLGKKQDPKIEEGEIIDILHN